MSAERKHDHESLRVTSHDSWVNPTTGVGGPQDKAGGFTFVGGLDAIYNSYIFSEMYEQDDIVATIVDSLVDEAMRRGFAVETDVEDPAAKEAIQDWIDRFRVKEVITEARKWSRLHGGAATLIGSDDGLQETPLQFGGRVRFVTNFERDELHPAKYYEDPLSPKFGTPSHYRVTPVSSTVMGRGNLVVHESRLLLFYGVTTTRSKRVQNQGWGSSVLLRCIKAVSQYYGAFASALAALADANQNVYKMKGLAEVLKMGNEAILQKRLELMDQFRSAIRAIALDADGEEFVRSSLALTGVEGILDKMALRLATAARMPVTRLTGQAPAGLNATGQSDERMFQASAQFEQSDILGPALTRLMRIAFRSPDGPTGGVEPTTWSIRFPPLWDPTAAESAQIDGTNAQVDQIYLDAGILRPSDVAKARFRGEQNNRVLLTAERIRELQAQDEAGSSTPIAVSTEPENAEATPVASTATTDEEEDDSVERFAQQMTDHGLERCPHEKKNRCLLCGIERIREIEPGPDGTPVFKVGWKPIGKRLSATPQPAIVATPGAPNAIAPESDPEADARRAGR